jgi:hypothetical protein
MAGMKKTKKMAKGGISAGIAKFKGKNGAKKMRGGGSAMMKKTKKMAKGGAMKRTKKMARGGAARSR